MHDNVTHDKENDMAEPVSVDANRIIDLLAKQIGEQAVKNAILEVQLDDLRKAGTGEPDED